MLDVYSHYPHGLDHRRLGPDDPVPEEAVWLDLLNPDRAEEAAVERMLGIDVPTREEMQEIEPSSRLYEGDGALFLTATVVSGADAEHPETTPVTFVLCGGRPGDRSATPRRAVRAFLRAASSAIRSTAGAGDVTFPPAGRHLSIGPPTC